MKNNSKIQNFPECPPKGPPEGPIVFLRHGETIWNVEGRYQGHQDTTLTVKGRDQARQCVDDIKQLIEKGELARQKLELFCSPLSRAHETACIIADELGYDEPSMIIAPQLQELSMGRWEGLNSQQVKDQFYTERQSRKTNRWNFKPVGGESLCGRERDVAAWLSTVPANSIVVTHSGILRIIHSILTASNREESSVLSIGHAEIWVWVCDKLHISVA